MNYLRRIIDDYKQRKQERKEQKEEQSRIKALNNILDQQLPTAHIICGENYKNKVEYFLMEFAPRVLKEYLAQEIEVGCKFVQLTGEDAGEMFYISKPCFLEKLKNGAQGYFLMTPTDLSVSINGYLNCKVESGKELSCLERYFGKTVTIRDVFRLRDAKHIEEEESSIDLTKADCILKINRLDECNKIARKEGNETCYRKS